MAHAHLQITLEAQDGREISQLAMVNKRYGLELPFVRSKFFAITLKLRVRRVYIDARLDNTCGICVGCNGSITAMFAVT